MKELSIKAGKGVRVLVLRNAFLANLTITIIAYATILEINF